MRVWKSKKSWRSLAVPEEDPEQLTLMPAVSAPSARAELRDSAGRQGASGAELREWPKVGERVLVRYQKFWTLRGVLEGVYDQEVERRGAVFWVAKRGRIRLDPEQSGLSPSLQASLPKVLSDVALSQLRKERK